MSAVDVAFWAIIAVVSGALIIWFLVYTFSGQTTAPSNVTSEGLKKRLVGSTGHATSDVTRSTGTVLVNSEEFSAKTSGETIQKGANVRVVETEGFTLVVEKV